MGNTKFRLQANKAANKIESGTRNSRTILSIRTPISWSWWNKWLKRGDKIRLNGVN